MQRLTRNTLAAAIALAAALLFVSAAFADRQGALRVRISDDCDAATFNAVVGPGTCDPAAGGETTFGDFIAQVTANKSADDWDFHPDDANVKPGATLNLQNVGGEFHTFTKVANFGPGFVDILNLLVFGVAGPPLPEFLAPPSLAADTANVPMPTAARETITAPTTPGTYKYQCGIHPWMRLVLEVKR